MFSNPFQNAFALDIGDVSIKLVQLRNTSIIGTRRPSFDIVTHRTTHLPLGLIINGKIEKPEPVRKYIRHLLGGNGQHTQRAVRSRWVVASLPDTQSFLKLIQIDKPQEDVIEEDVLYSAKKHIPFDEDAYYVDWEIMPHSESAKVTNVLIGAAPTQLADMYTYLLESLGLGIIALEIEALATARAMITAEKEYANEARAILDIGAVRSTLIIFDRQHLQFSRSLAYSGEILTTAIAQSLHISREEAERMKVQDGAQYKKSKIWPIVSRQTDALVKEVQKTFDFYYSHFPNANKITHVTMCGGGSAMKQLDKMLSLKLGIESKPGRVWKNLFSKRYQEIVDRDSLNYATAIGLALRAADNPLFAKDTI